MIRNIFVIIVCLVVIGISVDNAIRFHGLAGYTLLLSAGLSAFVIIIILLRDIFKKKH